MVLWRWWTQKFSFIPNQVWWKQSILIFDKWRESCYFQRTTIITKKWLCWDINITETEWSIDYARTRTTKHLLHKYPQENARCEWKEYKNLKNSFCGNEKNDVISYVSAIANMEGGHLVIGVKDKTLEIVGTDIWDSPLMGNLQTRQKNNSCACLEIY